MYILHDELTELATKTKDYLVSTVREDWWAGMLAQWSVGSSAL